MSSDSKITGWASKDGEKHQPFKIAMTETGHFRRQASAFRDSISKDKNSKFYAEKGRYHLYVSLACPWAHRALIVRKLKGLEEILPTSIVHPYMGSKGWSFSGEGYQGQGVSDVPDKKVPNVVPDPLYNVDFLRELYFKADKDYEGRFTVPVIWDSKLETVVNNESSEILRFMNTEFDDIIDQKYRGVTYYPENLQKEIDGVNEWVYDTVNNGVYKSGFASKEDAYLENVKKLDASLRRLEKMLDGKDYLVGDTLTEADIRLFTTIIRYDPVYFGHFKCNTVSIRHDLPNLNRWMKQLYHKNPAFKDTTDFSHIKIHYYTSHSQINPTGIVPYGPLPPIEDL